MECDALTQSRRVVALYDDRMAERAELMREHSGEAVSAVHDQSPAGNGRWGGVLLLQPERGQLPSALVQRSLYLVTLGKRVSFTWSGLVLW